MAESTRSRVIETERHFNPCSILSLRWVLFALGGVIAGLHGLSLRPAIATTTEASRTVGVTSATIATQPLPHGERRTRNDSAKESPLPKRKRRATVIVKSVSFTESKPNGEPWDRGSPPDPFVVVRNLTTADAPFNTRTLRDTLTASFNQRTVRVQEGDTIRLKVFDDDVIFDDVAGEFEEEITAEMIESRIAQWSNGTITIDIEFQR